MRGDAAVTVTPMGTTGAALALPDKPSVAVLPFTNMSGEAAQEYFADGITDDIITELSRFSELFVIARNSGFQYKGRPIETRRLLEQALAIDPNYARPMPRSRLLKLRLVGPGRC